MLGQPSYRTQHYLEAANYKIPSNAISLHLSSEASASKTEPKDVRIKDGQTSDHIPDWPFSIHESEGRTHNPNRKETTRTNSYLSFQAFQSTAASFRVPPNYPQIQPQEWANHHFLSHSNPSAGANPNLTTSSNENASNTDAHSAALKRNSPYNFSSDTVNSSTPFNVPNVQQNAVSPTYEIADARQPNNSSLVNRYIPPISYPSTLGSPRHGKASSPNILTSPTYSSASIDFVKHQNNRVSHSFDNWNCSPFLMATSYGDSPVFQSNTSIASYMESSSPCMQSTSVPSLSNIVQHPSNACQNTFGASSAIPSQHPLYHEKSSGDANDEWGLPLTMSIDENSRIYPGTANYEYMANPSKLSHHELSDHRNIGDHDVNMPSSGAINIYQMMEETSTLYYSYLSAQYPKAGDRDAYTFSSSDLDDSFDEDPPAKSIVDNIVDPRDDLQTYLDLGSEEDSDAERSKASLKLAHSSSSIPSGPCPLMAPPCTDADSVTYLDFSSKYEEPYSPGEKKWCGLNYNSNSALSFSSLFFPRSNLFMENVEECNRERDHLASSNMSQNDIYQSNYSEPLSQRTSKCLDVSSLRLPLHFPIQNKICLRSLVLKRRSPFCTHLKAVDMVNLFAKAVGAPIRSIASLDGAVIISYFDYGHGHEVMKHIADQNIDVSLYENAMQLNSRITTIKPECLTSSFNCYCISERSDDPKPDTSKSTFVDKTDSGVDKQENIDPCSTYGPIKGKSSVSQMKHVIENCDSTATGLAVEDLSNKIFHDQAIPSHSDYPLLFHQNGEHASTYRLDAAHRMKSSYPNAESRRPDSRQNTFYANNGYSCDTDGAIKPPTLGNYIPMNGAFCLPSSYDQAHYGDMMAKSASIPVRKESILSGSGISYSGLGEHPFSLDGLIDQSIHRSSLSTPCLIPYVRGFNEDSFHLSEHIPGDRPFSPASLSPPIWKPQAQKNKVTTPNFTIHLEDVISKVDKRTTLMIKNIPNKYDKEKLLKYLNKENKHTFDFLYLPIDFNNKCNLGYAFINIKDIKDIPKFYSAFNDKSWEMFGSEKICEITYAKIQGLPALKEHFNKPSMKLLDPKCRPLLSQSTGKVSTKLEPFPKLSRNYVPSSMKNGIHSISKQTMATVPNNVTQVPPKIKNPAPKAKLQKNQAPILQSKSPKKIKKTIATPKNNKESSNWRRGPKSPQGVAS